MKLVLLLLLCCITATLQQYPEPYWFSPYNWLPYFYNGYFGESEPAVPSKHYSPYVSRPRESIAQQDAELLKLLLLNSHKTQEPEIDSSLEGRVKILPGKIKEEKVEDRGFGGLKWLGFNALVNSLSASSSTTTRTTFTTSTLTVGTVVSCYTRTMFTSTTPCRRRKRKLLPGLLLGMDESSDPMVSPSKPESIEASLELEAHKAREAKMVDGVDTSKFLVESSINEGGEVDSTPEGTVSMGSRHPRQQRYFGGILNNDSNELLDLLSGTVYVTTTTATSYSFYTSATTSTITRLAATTALSCLPACFTLC